jgi:hypothetical protein
MVTFVWAWDRCHGHVRLLRPTWAWRWSSAESASISGPGSVSICSRRYHSNLMAREQGDVNDSYTLQSGASSPVSSMAEITVLRSDVIDTDCRQHHSWMFIRNWIISRENESPVFAAWQPGSSPFTFAGPGVSHRLKVAATRHPAPCQVTANFQKVGWHRDVFILDHGLTRQPVKVTREGWRRPDLHLCAWSAPQNAPV